MTRQNNRDIEREKEGSDTGSDESLEQSHVQKSFINTGLSQWLVILLSLLTNPLPLSNTFLISDIFLLPTCSLIIKGLSGLNNFQIRMIGVASDHQITAKLYQGQWSYNRMVIVEGRCTQLQLLISYIIWSLVDTKV